MMDEARRKAFERQVWSMRLSRELSLEDQAEINALMKDQNLSDEVRFTKIINFLKEIPEREFDEEEEQAQESEVDNKKNKVASKNQSPKDAPVASPMPKMDGERVPDINGPTETKLYINDIYNKYRKFKIFKRRYLVSRNNSLGFGLRKRLIPTKKFLSIMQEIHSYQNQILMRLPNILEGILRSESFEKPLEFNYLREFRKFMLLQPFGALDFDRIKWMEQYGFERELKPWVIKFYSFMRIDVKDRDKILLAMENFLRQEPDLQKEEVLESDSRSMVARKEKGNYKKEKEIYEYLGLVRSFLPIPGELDSLIAQELNKRYGIFTLSDFINMTMEALVFQRFFAMHELNSYYDIRTLTVSSEKWDYSEEKLKQYGKDPSSKKRKRFDVLKESLKWYEVIYQMVNLDEKGKNLLHRSLEEQWKIMDRVNMIPHDIWSQNFILYVEGLVHYFDNLIRPILSGESLHLKQGRKTFEGRLFSPAFFETELREMTMLSNSFYSFKSENPTLKITRQESENIMKHRISSMTHVEKLLFAVGESFYQVGKKLHEVYHSHISRGAGQQLPPRHSPLGPEDISDAMVPYGDCIFEGYADENRLARRIAGLPILAESLKGGIFLFFMAYCYQVASLCFYPGMLEDLSKRDKIRRELNILREELR